MLETGFADEILIARVGPCQRLRESLSGLLVAAGGGTQEKAQQPGSEPRQVAKTQAEGTVGGEELDVELPKGAGVIDRNTGIGREGDRAAGGSAAGRPPRFEEGDPMTDAPHPVCAGEAEKSGSDDCDAGHRPIPLEAY